jgi:hypothetical protein
MAFFIVDNQIITDLSMAVGFICAQINPTQDDKLKWVSC